MGASCGTGALAAAIARAAAAAFVGAPVVGVTVTGKISVLSSLFFFGLGSGATKLPH